MIMFQFLHESKFIERVGERIHLPDVAYSINGRHVECSAGDKDPERRTTDVNVYEKNRSKCKV